MDFSVESLHAMEKEFSVEMKKVLKTVKVASTNDLNENALLKLNKNSLSDIILRLVNLCEKMLTLANLQLVNWIK